MNVSAFTDRKVTQVAALARKLALSNGCDQQAFDALRREVAGELLHQEKLEVLPSAMGLLAGDRALASLRQVIEHCTQVFYLEDSVAVAIVVPVTIRLKSEMDGACTVWKGNSKHVEQAAMLVRSMTGANKVVFDERIYTGSGLHQARARDMKEYLLALLESANGKDVTPIARPAQVKSAVDADWETVYFIGVATYPDASKLFLEDPAVRAKMTVPTRNLAWALDQSNPLSWAQGVDAEIKAHGFWYLNNGLREGESVGRENRLKSFVANFDQGVTGVDFYYTVDYAQSRIRLLACSHLMSAEHKWGLYSGDDLEGFLAVLDAAISDCMPDVNMKREVEVEQYERIAKSRGVIWE